jgi:hypothetical protein
MTFKITPHVEDDKWLILTKLGQNLRINHILEIENPINPNQIKPKNNFDFSQNKP